MKLLARSTTLAGILKLIGRFYGGSTITLVEKDKDSLSILYAVHNANGTIPGVAVQQNGTLYRFWKEDAA